MITDQDLIRWELVRLRRMHQLGYEVIQRIWRLETALVGLLMEEEV